ncbi:ROK family transcriptional regulator [Goodfellowiella coeruleoviolacea]|uniref:Sugar kinase of the NBD/HSP70 family, may containing an N-terminal HTH domain n=1 Tax=Goodfellowiella coeruleoviolacea TaxID=334858 RepID=A0AAE3GHU0_9PSEU|nr:ROK family transcriptional regulator [Goodfellowiella coeruleoviolacea]MCP2168482.1 Sugar kinase of the NBD/HSP70 family, may containing an N-terminal HTH domain [Goodfellowiella coeruleoviolacea]
MSETRRPHSGSPSLLRLINSVAVLSALRESSPATLSDLATRTGLSRPTVESAVEDLVEQGWAAELAAEADQRGGRRVGRPARRYVFRADSGYVLGLDIGAHRVLGVLADLNGEPVHTHQTRVDPRLDADARIAVVRGVANRCLAEGGIDRRRLMAAGVGSPGIIDRAGTVTVSTVLPGWVGLPLARRLSRSFGCPVLVDNDANLAALAERWHGVATQADSLVYLLVGRRIGAALVLDGKVHRGFGGAAGEIGLLDPKKWELCRERLLGPATTASIDDRDHQVTEQIIASARAGDSAALSIVDDFCAVLAQHAAAMTLTVDPEMVVLGGGLASADDLLLPRLQQHIDRVCIRSPRILASSVGEEAVVLGAVRLALQAADEALHQRARSSITARGSGG